MKPRLVLSSKKRFHRDFPAGFDCPINFIKPFKENTKYEKKFRSIRTFSLNAVGL